MLVILKESEELNYLQNFSGEELNIAKNIVNKVARSIYANDAVKANYEFQDIKQELELALYTKASRGDIPKNLGELKLSTTNIGKDFLRAFGAEKRGNYVQKIDLDQQPKDDHEESGEIRAFKMGADYHNDDHSEMEIRSVIDSPRLKPEERKLAVIRGYLDANMTFLKKDYDEYKNELSDEAKADLEDRLKKNHGHLTNNDIIQLFFGVKSGINSGSARKYTKDAPAGIKKAFMADSLLREAEDLIRNLEDGIVEVALDISDETADENDKKIISNFIKEIV